ncbi:MAG: hypothetical protein D6769_00190 [Methanobacteriota archaeon]|nr:MAG: hypothetical protein D6769_00190 [Euryarchaeota archaeon]
MLAQDAIEKLRSKQTRWVQLHFPDLYGVLRSRTVTSSSINTLKFDSGFTFHDLSDTFNEVYEETFSLMPLADTYGTLPWNDATDRFICSIKTSNKERYLKDVTYTVERAEQLFKAELKELPSVKQSINFYMSDGSSIESSDARKSVEIPTKEAPWNHVAIRNQATLSHASEPADSYSGIRQQIADVLTNFFNMSVFSHGHGRANNSQQVMTFDEMPAHMAAHALATLKMAARAVGIVNVAIPTFMALPFANDAPNDYKFSIASFVKGTNVFYDSDDELFLSQKARYFIGGILEHARSLAFFTNPTVNSYKRLAISHKFTSAGKNDKYNAVLIHDATPTDYNFELTFPDPLANPYFALASVLAAGVDGLKKKTEPNILKESPLILSEGQRRRKKVHDLPKTLIEAISELESDNDYLKGVFSTDIVYNYTELKLQEFKDSQSMPSNFDYAAYFHL